MAGKVMAEEKDRQFVTMGREIKIMLVCGPKPTAPKWWQFRKKGAYRLALVQYQLCVALEWKQIDFLIAEEQARA